MAFKVAEILAISYGVGAILLNFWNFKYTANLTDKRASLLLYSILVFYAESDLLITSRVGTYLYQISMAYSFYYGRAM